MTLSDRDIRWARAWLAAWCHQRKMYVHDVEDLVQEILVRLVDAARRYEPGRGIPWRAYLARLLRQRAIDWVRLRLGRSERTRARKRIVDQMLSFDAPSGEDGRRTFVEVLPARAGDPALPAIAAETYAGLLARCRGRERTILRLLAEGRTAAEIAPVLGLCHEWVLKLIRDLRAKLSA